MLAFKMEAMQLVKDGQTVSVTAKGLAILNSYN